MEQKTMKHTLRATRAGLAAALTALSLAAPSGAAAQDVPEDAEILGTRIEVVQPVLVTGNSIDGAWAMVGATIQSASADKGALKSAALPMPTPGPQGFGFAGSSNQEDIAILTCAYGLGMVPAMIASGETERLKKMLPALQERKALLQGLSKEAQAAATRLLESSAEGRIDGDALAAALRAGESGIAAGPQRAHGYFVTGLWVGLAVLGALDRNTAAMLADMAHPIAVFLEEDASLGGSDRKLAQIVRGISAELRKPKVDVTALLALVQRIPQVQADR